ncbi:hypothetical protein J1614_012208 [Plenodomus biglobosus]|nr:hypothetical protein J1614_012208 [Plenodomus biglobosus]
MPDRSSHTLTKCRKVHDLGSSSSDEADLFELSSPPFPLEYGDKPSSSETNETPTMTPTKTRIKPPSKKTRFATPFLLAPSKPKIPLRNEKKPKFGFETPASNHPSKPHPNTPTAQLRPAIFACMWWNGRGLPTLALICLDLKAIKRMTVRRKKKMLVCGHRSKAQTYAIEIVLSKGNARNRHRDMDGVEM